MCGWTHGRTDGLRSRAPQKPFVPEKCTDKEKGEICQSDRSADGEREGGRAVDPGRGRQAAGPNPSSRAITLSGGVSYEGEEMGRKGGLVHFLPPSISNNATFTLFHSECGKVKACCDCWKQSKLLTERLSYFHGSGHLRITSLASNL